MAREEPLNPAIDPASALEPVSLHRSGGSDPGHGWAVAGSPFT